MSEEIKKQDLQGEGEECVENTAKAPETDVKETKESKENEKKKKIKKLEGELAAKEKALSEAEAKYAELDDKYMRLYAEYDNFRKRSAKEKESIYSDACADVLASILPIADTLDRAANTEGDAEQVRKGLMMILKSFEETLGKLGVKEMDCLGKEFDPNLQNAVMHVEDESYGENVVVEVLMKGYEKDGKVIRHAMVKVAN